MVNQGGCRLCQIFNTLIANADNLYDLNRLDDQLVLGIKATLSVVDPGARVLLGSVTK